MLGLNVADIFRYFLQSDKTFGPQTTTAELSIPAPAGAHTQSH
jgi:hypothetical protein